MILDNSFYFSVLSPLEFLSESFRKKARNGIPDWMSMTQRTGDTLIANWFFSISIHIICLLSDTLIPPEATVATLGSYLGSLASILCQFYFWRLLRSLAACLTGKVSLAFVASIHVWFESGGFDSVCLLLRSFSWFHVRWLTHGQTGFSLMSVSNGGVGLMTGAGLRLWSGSQSLYLFLNEDGKQTAGHHQPGTSCSTIRSQALSAPSSPRAAVLLMTQSFLAQAMKIIFSEF